MIEEYTHVRIKKLNITANVIAIDTDGGTKPPIYLCEKDEKRPNEEDLIWCRENELEII